jgi:ABC-type sugar transport system ATPase subunit
MAGPPLQLVDVSYRAGSASWLYPMSLSLKTGMSVLLGATSAGKTTLMRLMAGLERPTSGRILVDGEDVTGVPVRRRNLAMVYQQFINYPSLSVFENIASPLRLARRPDETVRQRVGAIAETLRLTPFLDRRPAELSGGQQQRVALARALACQPQVLLLDEPFAALNPMLRSELRSELAQVRRQWGIPVLMITHDIEDVLALADVAFVYDNGRVVREIDLHNAESRDIALREAGGVPAAEATPLHRKLRGLLMQGAPGV